MIREPAPNPIRSDIGFCVWVLAKRVWDHVIGHDGGTGRKYWKARLRSAVQ